MTSPEHSNLRRKLLWVSNWLTKWLKCDLPHCCWKRACSSQFGIGWKELLGHVPQVPVLTPSGSANDYAGFIIEEDIHVDSLLLKPSQ